MGGDPLVLGTAGHVDHGKTSLVRALTGRDTDRLAAEVERGMSIELGFAPLDLPSGRRVSLIDVPGHERFVRHMVAGSTGVDGYLLCVAADDGVMPQTREHLAVLDLLGVREGVVAITRSDLADPADATAQLRALLGPSPEIVAVCAPSGGGIDGLRDALERLVAGLPARRTGGRPRLFVDRAFTVRGTGTVVTGTLWGGGAISRGDLVRVLPGDRSARVRGVEVHDAPAESAAGGSPWPWPASPASRRPAGRASSPRETAGRAPSAWSRGCAGSTPRPRRRGAAGACASSSARPR